VLSTNAAHEATPVEFDADGTTLRGWLYRPRGRATAAPAVVMAHGYNCIKELYPGGHFSAYTDQFDRAAKAATEWFTQHLRP
jgi:poly(3-hydroxybutyrate) depolymerase